MRALLVGLMLLSGVAAARADIASGPGRDRPDRPGPRRLVDGCFGLTALGAGVVGLVWGGVRLAGRVARRPDQPAVPR